MFRDKRENIFLVAQSSAISSGLTCQSAFVCIPLYASVSANPSFRSANCPYLSVRPVRFGVAVDPPIGPSINPSVPPCHPPSYLRACVRACYLSNLSANLRPLLLDFSLPLSLLPLIPPSIKSLRGHLLSHHALYLDLTRLDRPIQISRAPRLTRISATFLERDSRESPGDSPRFSHERESRADGIRRSKIRARYRLVESQERKRRLDRWTLTWRG